MRLDSNIIRLVHEKEKMAGNAVVAAGGSSGGVPPTELLTHRVSMIEKQMEKLDGKLDRLLTYASASDVRLATIDVKLDGKAAAIDITKLETAVATTSVKLDARASQSDLSEIKGKIDKFVDKWFVLKTCLWSLGGVSAFITGMTLFQDKIRSFIGVR